jgi:hypothetical protein
MPLATAVLNSIRNVLNLRSSGKKAPRYSYTPQKANSYTRKTAYRSSMRDKLLQSKISDLVKNFNTIYPELEPEVEFAWTGDLPSLRNSFFQKLAAFFSKLKAGKPALSH